MRISMDEFEILVERALDELPPEFGERLDNIVVVVEDEPTDEEIESVGLDPEQDDLLGIYRGIPLIERDSLLSGDLPDQVVIFRQPLLRMCRDRRELIREIRDTVVHELGHHFGLGDDEMPY